MEIGLNTDGPLDTIRSRGDVADREGFDFLEINVGDQTIRKSYWLDHSDEVAALLEERGLGLTVHLPKIDVLIGSPRDRLSESSTAMLADYLRIAREFGASKAILHPQYSEIDHPIRKDESRCNLLEGLERLENVAADEGISLLIENGIPDRSPGYEISLREFDTLFGDLSIPYAVNMSHAHITGMTSERIVEFVSNHRDRVSHIYLNDTRKPVDEHLPIGAGNIDFRMIFRRLRELGWDQTATMELKVDDAEYIRHSKRYIDSLNGPYPDP